MQLKFGCRLRSIVCSCLSQVLWVIIILSQEEYIIELFPKQREHNREHNVQLQVTTKVNWTTIINKSVVNVGSFYRSIISPPSRPFLVPSLSGPDLLVVCTYVR